MLTYSVVIPAFNEESFLPRTLEILLEAMAAIEATGEVVVVDNNSTDRTAQLAESFGAKVVFEKINQISRARNTGARHAAAQQLIFLDADTLISEKLLRTALGNLQRSDCSGGGATVAADRPLKPLHRNALKFWNRLSVRWHMAAGSFIYCRRDGFEAVGGFSEKVYVGEEIWFSIHYRRWGKLQGQEFVIIDDAPVVTSTRKLDWFSHSRTASMLLPMLLFPIICRHRSLCGYWYRRPADNPPPNSKVCRNDLGKSRR
jgi:glycosyltransferase involved in cell wall biosynthesis